MYFKSGCLPVALRELRGRKRAFIVTDKPLYDMGMTKGLEEVLEEVGVKYDIFYNVEPDPSLATVNRGLDLMKTFNPDVIIAFGGGSPMDAAKVMWMMYDNPEIEFEGLATRFMDIRKRVYDLPDTGQKDPDGGDPHHFGHRLRSHPLCRCDRRPHGDQVSPGGLCPHPQHGHRRS